MHESFLLDAGVVDSILLLNHYHDIVASPIFLCRGYINLERVAVLGRSELSSQRYTKMSNLKEEGVSQRPGHAKSDDKLHFEETTDFGHPASPTKNDIYVNNGYSASSTSDEDGDDLKKNPFLDPDVAEKWALVYEKSRYECRTAFDPAFTWTEEEERRVVRRLDWRVCLWAVSDQVPRYDVLLTLERSVSCSSACKSTVEISFRLCPIIS